MVQPNSQVHISTPASVNTQPARHWIGRLFLMSAIPLMWLQDSLSLTAMVVGGVIFFLILAFNDSDRGIRRRPSSIMARFMFAVWAFLFLGFYWMGNHAAGRTYFSFADTIICAFWITLIITAVFWSCLWFASQLVLDDPDYRQWTIAGGHYFWDTLPAILNPDSEMIRNGGFVEPSYTDFTPPPHWQHQCPVCGARVEHAVDVCWNCCYGADGDSSAYFRRYGR
ncbi:hypothetical protein [Novipirellula artificiosorum]|uniref:Uncharacterized protein n=1 Tax=Novipirellula artificiosorum TaxID=2528016 RepID=A0A5C6E057_9BACT|nr:hypothetical protein [Novipirellula artificiosorum]TWU41864.1 hypothetical protein Poly41_01570 [Novipirellula artificiosorum]